MLGRGRGGDVKELADLRTFFGQTSSIIQLRAKVKKLSAVIQETQAHPELHLGKTATAFVTFDSMVRCTGGRDSSK